MIIKINKDDTLSAYSNLVNLIDMKNLLGHLEEIKSEITRVITVIEQTPSEQNTASGINNLIGKLRGG